MRTQWTTNGNRDAVLLAYAIEDSTDIFRILGGVFEHPKPPLSVRHCNTVFFGTYMNFLESYKI